MRNAFVTHARQARDPHQYALGTGIHLVCVDNSGANGRVR
jgi:hypothetical protein